MHLDTDTPVADKLAELAFRLGILYFCAEALTDGQPSSSLLVYYSGFSVTREWLDIPTTQGLLLLLVCSDIYSAIAATRVGPAV